MFQNWEAVCLIDASHPDPLIYVVSSKVSDIQCPTVAASIH